MNPHELAQRIAQTEPELDMTPAPPEFVGLGSLIDTSQGVWQDLVTRNYDLNEFGYINFSIIDSTNDPRGPETNNVDAINVIFRPTQGVEVVLGGIHRARDPKRGLAWANIDLSGKKRDYLTPDDERWDVVVGTITRAIMSKS